MKNKLIQGYYYIERGLDILNIFRNLFLAIFAVFVALKFVSVWWAIGMFVITIPILIITGYFNVHHIGKVRDRLNIKFGTHYGIKVVDYQKRTMELLEEINQKLK
jgi:hypothetical protein